MSTKKLERFFVRLILIGIPLCFVLSVIVIYLDALVSPYLGSDLSRLFLVFIALVIFYSVIGKSLKEAVDEQKGRNAREDVKNNSR